MGALFKRSLGKLFQGKAKPQAAEVFLAAFGKHPGWDDHIEDLGLETDRLVHLRRLLYVQGIAGNIDSGAWERLADHERLEGFHHLFLWVFPGDLVVGRMWSSRDGKGRTRYPMVVCAQCRGIALDWALRHVLPRLEELNSRCTQTTAAPDVRAAIAETRQTLRREAQGLEPVAHPITPSPRALARLADSPEMAPERLGMHRVLYQIRREMGGFLREGAERTATGLSVLRAAQMRVPLCAPSPRDALSLWLRFLFTRVDPSTPLLAFLRLDHGFLDIIVGDPGVQQFYCVRASTEAVPLTTEIPYNLDPAFVAEAEKEIDEARGGPPPQRPPTPQPPHAEQPPAGQPQGVEPPARPVPEPAPPARPQAPAPPPRQQTPAQPAPSPPRRPTPPSAPPERPQPPAAQAVGSEKPAPHLAPQPTAPAPGPQAVVPRPAQPERQFPQAGAAAAEEAPSPVVVRRRFPRLLALLVGVAVLVVAALLAFPLVSQLGKAPEKPPEPIEWKAEHARAWKTLCEAYNGWFGRFEREATRKRLEAWRTDPLLASGIVARMEGARGVVFDPREIIGEPAADLDALALNPPERARMSDSFEKTSKALAIVRAIQQTLARWPAEGKAPPAELVAAFEKRGWTSRAAAIRSAIEALKPAPGNSIADAIDRMLALRRQLAAIEKQLADAKARESDIAALNPELAKALHQKLLAEAAQSQSLDLLRANLQKSASALATLANLCRQTDHHRANIEKLAGHELAERFKALTSSLLGQPQPIEKLAALLEEAQPVAATIEERLGELDKLCRAVADAAGKPAAGKVRELALAGAKAAPALPELADALARALASAADVQKSASKLKSHAETLLWLGQEMAKRRAERIARAGAAANSLDAMASALAAEARLAAETADALDSLLGHQRVIAKSNDKVLAQFGRYAAARARAVQKLDDLPQTLKALDAAAAQLAAFVQNDLLAGKIDRDLFTAHSNVHRTFDGTFTDQTLKAWRTEVELYRKLDPASDPRPQGAKLDKALDDIAWRVSFLKESPDPQKKALGQKCAASLESIAKGYKALATVPWVAKNKSTVEKQAADLAAKLHALQEKLKDVVEPPAKWLASIRATNALTHSKAVNAEWVKRRDLLVPPATTAEQLLKDPRAYTKLWRAARRLREFLKGLDDPEQLPPELPRSAQKAPDAPLRSAFKQKLAERREKAIGTIIANIRWRDDKTPSVSLADFKASGSWQQPRDAYLDWRNAAAAALVAVCDLKAQLDAGYLPDRKPPNATKTARQLHDQLRAAGVPPGLLPLVKPQLSRVAALLALRGSPREKLVAMAKTPDKLETPQAAMVVWLRLGDFADWPRDLDELKAELALRERVKTLRDEIRKRNPPAVAWLPQALVEQGVQRWSRCLRRLAAAARPDDLADPQITACMKLAPSFEVVFENIPADIRLVKELYDFRQRAAAIPDDAAKQTVDAAVGRFLETLAAIPGGAPARAKPLLGELQAFLKQKVVEDPAAGLDKAGPVSGPLADQWKVEIKDGGRWVVYSWPDYGHELTFVRVEPKSRGARPAYLCTTETSAGLFIDVLRATNNWLALGRLLYKLDTPPKGLPPNGLPPKGPRTWEWERRSGGAPVLKRSRHWLARESTVGAHYPNDLDPGRPGKEHPIQYVSAPAALFAAWLLGCRLPTQDEWRAAYEAAGHPEQGANLRDATWRRQRDHMARKQADGFVPEWPDAGIFIPPKASVRRGERAAIVSDTDDGTLWFRPVGGGAKFQHLVGNVAEFVFEPPRNFEKDAAALRGKKAAEAAASFLETVKSHADGLGVIGASALSPPELWDGRKKPFTTAWPVELRKKGWDSFSDVGFRLAFTAPRERPADQLRRILARWGYLVGGPR